MRRRSTQLARLIVMAAALALALSLAPATGPLADRGRAAPKKSSSQTKKATSQPKEAPPPPPKSPEAAADASGAETAADIARRRQELLELKQQIERESAEAEKLRGREKKVLSEIQSADKRLVTTKAYLKKLAQQEGAITHRLGQLELDIDARESELERANRRLAHRVREIYKTGQPTWIEVVFSAESVPDLADRVYLMTRLADEERKLMETIDSTRRALVADRSEVERNQAEIQQIGKEKQREQNRLSGLKKERESQISDLRKKRETHEQAARELKAAQERLESIIRQLEARRKTAPEFIPPSGPFANARGNLPWPVQGKVLEGFGLHTHPKFGTSTRNNGIDIAAEAGTPVRAVADGKVDYRDWLTGYGNCVILNHGGGYYTLYAHLADVGVTTGLTLAGGAVIGTVGDTGSLKGPMLHFEVRQGSRAVDPGGWLR